ncbi:MAG: SprT-like domain-containing protein [Thermodesulfobacteriota bacterium]|nr:SprT-like domain-containing protein [Thermodesulfobacteriota bacterium]
MEYFQGNTLAEIENHLIEKLRYEWEGNIMNLKRRAPDFAKTMKMPSILLSDMKSLLGQWISETREIRLSRDLVFNGRWDSVCEVLKHEMAHQLASTFPQSRNETAHGKTFLECCHALGANPRASGTYKTLEQRVFEESDDENDRVMIKVKKLMNLALSENRHEAEKAAAKANQLIAKYNIDIIQKNRPREFESIYITRPTLKRTQAQQLASIILDDYYFVKHIWISVYMPERGKTGSILEISGTRPNIKIADYVFHYILNYAEKCWQAYKKENPGCRSRSGFMAGVVRGFDSKLEEQNTFREQKQPSNINEPHALINIKDKALARFYHHNHPSIQTTAVSCQSASQTAYLSGIDRGEHLTVSKAISSTGTNSGRLLE